MKTKSTLELAKRLNEIMVEENNMGLRSMELSKEHDAIVYELWERYPNLKESADIQPTEVVEDKKYEVMIITTNGVVKTGINDFSELEELLTQYYETYISVEVRNREICKKKVRRYNG